MSRHLLRAVIWAVVFLVSGPAGNVILAESNHSNVVVPRLVRFSGTLVEASGKPIQGVTEVSFSLFQFESGGEPLWFETQTIEVDAQGRYNVLLGAMHADGLPTDLFTSGEARWLSIMVGKVEQPRILLVSVPYALKAGDAESLGGKPATAYVATDQLQSQVESTLSSSRYSQRTLNTTLLATGGGSETPPAIVETNPSTFTCTSAGNCVTVTQNGTGHGLSVTAKAGSGIAQGVRGESLSPTGRGVYGIVNQPSGVNYGVRGDSASTQGYGVFGNATSATGLSYGLYGQATSTGGVGLSGRAIAVTGATIGLRGIVDSPAGTAAVFENRAGGPILSGRSTGLVEKFSVSGAGNVVAAGSVTAASFVGSGAGLTNITAAEAINADTLDGVHASGFAVLGANTFAGNQTVTGDLAVSGSITASTGAVSAAGGSYSGTTADQIVSVVQSGTGSGLTGTTLGVDASSAGVWGLATNDQYLPVESAGAGVYGYSAARLGAGVKGMSSAFKGIGVRGEVTHTTGWNIGVQGITPSTDSSAAGVEGISTGAVGVTRGVRGIVSSSSASSAGVYGTAQAGDGVAGSSSAGAGVGGYGNPGVKGQNYSTGIGVLAVSDHGTGLKAEVTSIGYYLSTALLATTATSQDGTQGVYGWTTNLSGASIGVHGRSDSSTGTGVWGEATSTAFGTFGVKGTTASSLGTAVAGLATGGGIGSYAESDTNISGDFNRIDDSDSGIILQARNGGDIEFKVLGDGNVYADGTFTGGGADFAEAMAVRGDREQYGPGDVLVIDAASDRQITLAQSAYSTHVAGIYSTKPGMLGRPYPMEDPRLERDIPLAVMGIVPCKVSAENGPIGRGDLLVTSATQGHAMKGSDHSRMLGAIVGKALEPLQEGTGVIEVLVTLQ